jgi:hypothetical protein
MASVPWWFTDRRSRCARNAPLFPSAVSEKSVPLTRRVLALFRTLEVASLAPEFDRRTDATQRVAVRLPYALRTLVDLDAEARRLDATNRSIVETVKALRAPHALREVRQSIAAYRRG